jgi:hypothetical protein
MGDSAMINVCVGGERGTRRMGEWRTHPDRPVDRAVPAKESTSMSKRARKRRDRKKSSANHGNRPNA